tara:strand:- start:39849 stop:40196 length:348 start_codon:yes stop_codon:yes gene_type:complete
MKGAGSLTQSVCFDAPVAAPDGRGGIETTWGTDDDAYKCRAEFIYSRGSEAVDAARLQGRAIYKVKIRSSAAARAITPDWRMRDRRRNATYNIREVDAITDRAWIYIVVEGGVSV